MWKIKMLSSILALYLPFILTTTAEKLSHKLFSISSHLDNGEVLRQLFSVGAKRN